MVSIRIWTADGDASLTLEGEQTFACSREVLVHWLQDALRWFERHASGEMDVILDADIISSEEGENED